MDIKRLRTFVTVADLGTVSKAALRLRISQSALSRQIADLEYECGFRLFDRIGRRLFLTTRGEQLLGYCRGVLGQMDSLGERIELLKRGDSGVIKVAAPPQTIESVLSKFLPRYAERFPNVRVKLIEALGMDQVPLIERGEVDVGIRHDQGARGSKASRCRPTTFWPRARRRCRSALAGWSISWHSPPIRCYCRTRAIRCAACSTPPAASPASNPISYSRAAPHTPCSRSSKPSRGLPSFRRCCEPTATG